MTPTTLSRASLIVALAIPLSALQTGTQAQSDGSNRMSVTVAFGAGLNTAQPGNAANHHVLPNTIEIKAGGVVNFAVAGFHQIVVYNPGTEFEDIVLPAFPPNLFVNYQLAHRLLRGDQSGRRQSGDAASSRGHATTRRTASSRSRSRSQASTW